MGAMIFGMFIIGHLLHVGLQIDAIARSESNQITSRWYIVSQNVFRLSARLFVSSMIFIYGWNHPETIPSFLGYMGVTVSDNFKGIITLPVNAPIAGLTGFSLDTLLTYVPWLKNQLPPIEFTQTETHIKETKTVTETTTLQQGNQIVSDDVSVKTEETLNGKTV